MWPLPRPSVLPGPVQPVRGAALLPLLYLKHPGVHGSGTAHLDILNLYTVKPVYTISYPIYLLSRRRRPAESFPLSWPPLLYTRHCWHCLDSLPSLVREAIKKKADYLWISSVRGLTPPPPYFRKLWNPWGTFEFWSPKKGKNITSQKHPKWPYLKNLFKKSAQKCPKPSILNKKTLTLEAQKCASKVMDWVTPPPPLTEEFHN